MTEQLPEEKEKEYKEVFKRYADKDGAIKTMQLGDVLKDLGQDPNQAELQETINKVNKDGSRKMELNEFMELFANKIKNVDIGEDVKEVFYIFDKEGNGVISAAEFRYVMTSLRDRLTEKEADEMIKKADPDGDGFIHYKEFCEIMKINEEKDKKK